MSNYGIFDFIWGLYTNIPLTDIHASCPAILIGASLSEPHTSGTALLTCVCMFACLLACLLACLRPYTVNF